MSILQTCVSLFLIQAIVVESVNIVLNNPPGQYAAMVVRSEFKLVLTGISNSSCLILCNFFGLWFNCDSPSRIKTQWFPIFIKTSCWQYVIKICQNVSNSSLLTLTLLSCLGVGTLALDVTVVDIVSSSNKLLNTSLLFPLMRLGSLPPACHHDD